MLEQIDAAFDLMDQGRLDDALALLDSLAVPETDVAYYDYLSTYGYVHVAKKDYSLAIQDYEAYLSKAVAERDRLHQHRAHHQLAMVYREMGDHVSAMAELDKERAIMKQDFAGDDLIWAVHLYEVAYLTYLSGDHSRAEQVMKVSLDHALRTDDLIAQACSYRGLGEILSSSAHLKQAKALFEEAGDPIGSQEMTDLLRHLP